MFNKLFLATGLLCALNLGASPALESWLAQNGLQEKFQQLSADKQKEVEVAVEAMEQLSAEFQKEIIGLIEKHKPAVETIKGLLGTKTLMLTVGFEAGPDEKEKEDNK